MFRPDPDYLENEEKYKQIREDILGEGVGSDTSESEEGSEDSEEESEEGTSWGVAGSERGMVLRACR